MVLGDFNCVLWPDEKVNGNQPTAYQLTKIQELCVAHSLANSLSTGFRFTWNKGRTWIKLDRVTYPIIPLLWFNFLIILVLNPSPLNFRICWESVVGTK